MTPQNQVAVIANAASSAPLATRVLDVYVGDEAEP